MSLLLLFQPKAPYALSVSFDASASISASNLNGTKSPSAVLSVVAAPVASPYVPTQKAGDASVSGQFSVAPIMSNGSAQAAAVVATVAVFLVEETVAHPLDISAQFAPLVSLDAYPTSSTQIEAAISSFITFVATLPEREYGSPTSDGGGRSGGGTPSASSGRNSGSSVTIGSGRVSGGYPSADSGRSGSGGTPSIGSGR